MNFRIGTMGFGYSYWLGTFYPRGTKSSDQLAIYASHFDSVELDTTFHASPDPARVAKWAESVPANFRFCVKTPKAITHEKPLDRGHEAMADFLYVLRGFGAKLGAVLVQFPPAFTTSELPRFRDFVRRLPTNMRFAIEFRHESWFREPIYDLCRQLNLCLVSAEYVSTPRPIVVTTDFLYLRLIGLHEQFTELNREQADREANLAWWRDELSRVGVGVATTYAMFNNDYAGYSVASAHRFMRLNGLPIPELPKSASPQQGMLF